jgi:hypothetical protein
VSFSLILRFNLRLGGFFQSHTIQDFKMQPSKYSKKDFKMELQRSRRLLQKVLDKPAVLSYEELGGLSDPGPQD